MSEERLRTIFSSGRNNLMRKGHGELLLFSSVKASDDL